MAYLGDYTEDTQYLDFTFATNDSTGAPTTLSGTPAISVYKQNSVTQSVAGVTLTVDFDGVTGLNHVRIDLSADAFYATAADYSVVITTGTVDSISVVGYTVATFSIENREATVDKIIDEPLTKATHNVANSLGKRLRELSGYIITADTAQGAGTGNNQIQLAASESAVDGTFDPGEVVIVDGTGAGQSRNILEYDGASRTATIDRDWKVNPDATSEYVLFCNAGREHVNEGLAQAGASLTITLNALASDEDNAYTGQIVFIRSGTGADQARRVRSYDGTSKVATMTRAWGTAPDATSAYVMLPTGSLSYQCIQEAMQEMTVDGTLTWDELNKAIAATFLGKVTGATNGASTIKVYRQDGTTVAITITTDDAQGNRSAAPVQDDLS